MNSPPPVRASARHGDINVAPVVRTDAPEPRRTSMTQHRLGSAGQDGGHEDTAPFEPAMTDCIDPLVHAVEPAPRHPCLDRPRVEPHLDQLPQGHDAVLPIGQFRDPPVTCLRFPSYVLGKCRHV